MGSGHLEVRGDRPRTQESEDLELQTILHVSIFLRLAFDTVTFCLWWGMHQNHTEDLLTQMAGPAPKVLI